ncbi:hypothetical protein COT42_01965 [Candidatus Saganbacteria bacterium CG08_land_8_20_14_0_20_45_16]|uniref:fructose-bisphosphatase n=1 Tax=Candidatus Saganbacteria bacterium CG08_land_8_20_14_0_20_45_16 TaxID=2014293 RepID=A0A2H0Y0R3_UNCSA|nr:MAG: hypothetical protein COT42_01965 [Candidatus Saganbacteria bacterium CG08_land_8_20_14_0_20_45_16]
MPVYEQGAVRPKGFPPTVEMLRRGIQAYRTAKGYEPRVAFPYVTMEKVLLGREFACNGTKLRISAVRFHEIAPPIADLGDVEMMSQLVIPGIAAAVAAYPFLGTGKKTEADGAATQAMRNAMGQIYMRGVIKGGEGGGRDQMNRDAALYMCEPVGTGWGPEVDFLVDPLEVTNQAKPLNLDKGEYCGGEGWEPKLTDPNEWYPGYSGALSLLAAINASGKRGGVRRLTDDLYLNKMFLPWQLVVAGLNVNSPAAQIVEQAMEKFGVTAEQLVASALGRSRHKHTFDTWIEAGMRDERIIKPTDGDSMYAWPIVSGLLTFAGLTGGVMEGIIGGLAGVPVGANMSFQFTSHAKLKEERSDADLLNPDHRFGFSDDEYGKMVRSELFDSEHIGSTLRRLGPDSQLRAFVLDAARNEVDTPGFSFRDFLREIAIAESRDPEIRKDFRFSSGSREFLNKIFLKQGWWDVRRVGQLSDFRFDQDVLYLATALTPNKWTPLAGMKEGNAHFTTESLFTGGSQTVFIMEVDSVKVS